MDYCVWISIFIMSLEPSDSIHTSFRLVVSFCVFLFISSYYSAVVAVVVLSECYGSARYQSSICSHCLRSFLFSLYIGRPYSDSCCVGVDNESERLNPPTGEPSCITMTVPCCRRKLLARGRSQEEEEEEEEEESSYCRVGLPLAVNANLLC